MPSDTWDSLQGMIRRVRIQSYDATGPQHTGVATGLKGETFTFVRAKEFGSSSVPPEGAHGLILMLGGSSDRAMLVSFDHADHGPRDLGPGHKAIYDANGNIISLVGTKLRIVASGPLDIVAAGAVSLQAGGAVAIQSASLTHNGKNIGDSHVHTGVVPGGANTGVPA